MGNNEQSVSVDDVSSGKRSTNVLSGTEAEKIETEDSNFLQLVQIRNHLKSLKFGWMKFYKLKSATFLPGFAYPADEDGECRAQSVRADGNVTDKKNIFFEFSENIDDELKDKAGKSALNKLNKKLYFSFV